MLYSRFWTLLKTKPGKPFPHPTMQLQDISILELTEDGLAYLWPEHPDRTDRCLYCSRFPSCKEDPKSNRPAFILFMLKSVLCAGDNLPAGRTPNLSLLDQTSADLIARHIEEHPTNPDSCKRSLMLNHMLALKQGREPLSAALTDLGCQHPANALYPCNFTQDPRATHQDLDSYMLDGFCEHVGGRYKNLEDFMLCYQYSTDDVRGIELGTFQTIRAAREAWTTYKTEH